MKSIIIGQINRCPKCHKLMDRRAHPKEWTPPKYSGHYLEWDKCEPCRHIQHYEIYYVTRAENIANESALIE